MRATPHILIVFALISGCFSCEFNEVMRENERMSVLFQYEYVNYAWGYQHHGWFVDNEGNIKGYDMPTDWRRVDDSGYIAYDSLIYNYQQADALLGKIDLGTLHEKSALIDATLNGYLSELDCQGADMGSKALYCYYWDVYQRKYKRQLLELTGDCEQVNTTEAALQLALFLNQIM